MKQKVSSRKLIGPPHLRYYPVYRLAAWQPHGVLSDLLLDEIAAWILGTEKVARLPFNRFIDLSQLTLIRLTINHIFTVAGERRAKYAGQTPVKSAFFCDKVVGFGVARMYEALMAGSFIRARAFRKRAAAAAWLEVPVEVLELKDVPMEAD
ncbi:MAG TPA: hypothetical protein VK581_15280 [Chthoniobacterales bacterium]|nr:hypothetical protein [Chthoniobacterales bacterium]